MPDFSFKKGERLKSKTLIGRLFRREGSSFAVYPLRAVWLEVPPHSPHAAQFGVSVPRKAFRHATDRNKLRRQIREAYRLHKHLLPQDPDRQLALMVLYTAKEPLPYTTIDEKMATLLRKLAQRTAAPPRL